MAAHVSISARGMKTLTYCLENELHVHIEKSEPLRKRNDKQNIYAGCFGASDSKPDTLALPETEHETNALPNLDQKVKTK